MKKENIKTSKKLSGHEKLIVDITALLKEAKAFAFHDFKNYKYATPKVELRNKILELADNVVEGKYDQDGTEAPNYPHIGDDCIDCGKPMFSECFIHGAYCDPCDNECLDCVANDLMQDIEHEEFCKCSDCQLARDKAESDAYDHATIHTS